MAAMNKGATPFLGSQSTKPKWTSVDLLKNCFEIFGSRKEIIREDLVFFFFSTKPNLLVLVKLSRNAQLLILAIQPILVEEDIHWGVVMNTTFRQKQSCGEYSIQFFAR